jgi:hypothetical protein
MATPTLPPSAIPLFGPEGQRLHLLHCGPRCQVIVDAPIPSIAAINGDSGLEPAVPPLTTTRSSRSATRQTSRWVCEVEILWVPRAARGLPAGAVQSVAGLSLLGFPLDATKLRGCAWLPPHLPPAIARVCHFRLTLWHCAPSSTTPPRHP